MIAAIGLNHKTAPISIREKLAFDPAQSLRALHELKSRFPDSEFVLLSTCNRVELYCASANSEVIDTVSLISFLSQFHELSMDDFRHLVYVHRDEHAVRHLLMVVSSLDSMVVGENQIIAQVKESYRLACTAGATGKTLNRLFHCAFSSAKKVHTNTSICAGRVSVAGVAVELATQLFADMSQAKIVVIGAGEMGELLVQHLLHAGCKNITVVNRSYDRGVSMADQHGIAVAKWEELESLLRQANVAIASASARTHLFSADSFGEIIGRRRQGALLIIDIAVPRNFEPSVNEIEDVYLYSIDDLSQIAEQNRKAREEDIVKAMRIVQADVADFMCWVGTRDIGPLIGRMKEKFGEISQRELDNFFVGARENASCRDVMEAMVKRIVNRLLHCVIKNVNAVAKEQGPSEAAKLLDRIVRQAEEVSAESGRGVEGEQ